MSTPEIIAAVDLGSNSFQLVVARVAPDNSFHVQDRIKRHVRLAGGLSADGALDPVARKRALDCIDMFAQRIAELPDHAVSVVGTDTLRRARDADALLKEVRRRLGHKVQVISGHEEARLVWAGVRAYSQDAGRQLVVDIGGGSTELIIGEGDAPIALQSRKLGHVGWSEQFFPDGQITRAGMKAAVSAAEVELASARAALIKLGWDTAVGSSGTVRAVERALIDSGMSAHGITQDGLKRLRRHLVEIGDAKAIVLPGVSDDRRHVFPGGVAILSAVFRTLQIAHMTAAVGALREGLLTELIGRISHNDIRDATVQRFADRCGIDEQQAARVAATALDLFDQVADEWELSHRRRRPMLAWAARLHEVGMFLTHSGYHRHSAYLIQHAELPGFSRTEQRALAVLVLAHRGRVDQDLLNTLYPGRLAPVLRMSVLLRLARRLHRARSDRALPEIRATARPVQLTLTFPEGWLDAHPLTRQDLAQESAQLARSGMSLTVR